MVASALLAVALAWHPIHASSAAVVLNPGGRGGELSIRVFAEDFPPGRDSSAIVHYVKSRFHVMSRGTRLDLVLDRFRIEGETQILELRLVGRAGCSGLTIWHGILTERFPDQVNLVKVRCGRRTRHLVFNPGEAPKRL